MLALFWKLVAKIAKNRQLRFFFLCHVDNHNKSTASCHGCRFNKFAKIAKNRKSLTIFRVTCDFSQFFVMLMFTFLVFMIT